MSRLGILGGTFDPVHNGHMYMAKVSLEQLELDKIIFIPTGIVPHKDNDSITNRMHRYNMVCCAVQEFENYKVSDMEIKRDRVCYTYETLTELKSINPNDELHFIIGADSMYYFDKWRKPEEILKLAAVTVIDRTTDSCHNINEYCRQLEKKYKGTIEVLSAHGPDISSTEIRRRVKNSESIDKLVPEPVKQYILKHKLYTEF